MHIAALGGHADAVKELLSSGAIVDIQNDKRGGQTPLQVAAIKGHSDVMTVLLDDGADIEHANSNFTGPQRALQLAIKQQHTGCVELLLSRGASVDCVENRKAETVAADPITLISCT